MAIIIKYQNDDEEYNFNSFEKITNYDKVVYINYYGKKLSVLPKLPNSLETLYCYDNQLSLLPELPNSLKILYCNNNQLSVLSELPNSLKILYCNNNQLSVLPELPNSLKYFDCYNNNLIKKIKHRYLNTIIY